MADVFVALVHFPVYNKNREVIASALTTIDLHDLARLAATYGLAGFYVVTPVDDQRTIAADMIAHWREGWGADYNQTRQEALSLVHLVRDVDEARAGIARNYGQKPMIAGTSAVDGPDRVGFRTMAGYLKEDRPILVLFGTGWGLTDEALAECDVIIEPVKGPTEYNHLSVRSAAGIILDRLFSNR